MKIGTTHRNKIWKSLVEMRGTPVLDATSQGLQRDLSSASTVSLGSQASLSQNSNYCPGYYEVTRYTFKHTISLAKPEKEGEAKKPKSKKLEMMRCELF